jgi:tetratricopeptide (TPR) repeat protein
MAAEQQKDYTTAEREFLAAVNVAHRSDAWSDLGAFYQRRGNGDKTVEAIRACVAANIAHDASLVDAASILNDANREPELQERLLRDYLRSPAQTDAAPTFRAHVMLGKVLKARGDKAAAKIEFESALALAADYAPAKEALQSV